MGRNEEWQQMLKEERLPHQLRVQSRQIDNVLQHRQMVGQVSGGVVTQKTIHFNLQSHLTTGFEKLRELKQDFLDALGVRDIKLERKEGQWQLQISRPDEVPVPLLELLPTAKDVPQATAVLGLSEEGTPILLNLLDDELSHAFIVGDLGAGKTTLLRSMAVSLALTNKQSQLQLAVITTDTRATDGEFASLEPLSYLPHLLEPVVTDEGTAGDLLNFLSQEMSYRLEQQVKAPIIVVMIDHLVTLLEKSDEPVRNGLMQLVQKGASAGIHLIATSEKPDSPLLTAVFKSSMPVRLVGRIADPQVGLAATGDSDIHPDYFWGKGDFAMMTAAGTQYFQAAHIGDYDLHLTIDTLHRYRPRPLLAQLFEQRPAAVDSSAASPTGSSEAWRFTAEGQIEDRLQDDQKQPPHKNDPIIINLDPQPEKKENVNEEIPFDAGRGWDLLEE